MSEIKMKRKTFVLLIVVVVVLVLLLNSTFKFLPIGNIGGLDEVASLISSHYVDKIEKEKLVEDGVSGMVTDLDPYSEYLDRKELEGLLETSKGEFQGVGMEIAIRDDYPTVISPLEGTPAYEAGIKSGDKIIRIDDISAKGLSGEEAQQMIRGPKDSEVMLTILREGIKEPLEFKLKRDVISIKSVTFAGELEEGIGYIRLIRFSENAPAELKDALNGLKIKNIKGLILDLRGNPGGLLKEAVEVSDFFLEKGELILEVKGRKDSKKFYSQTKPIYQKTPLIVLVDFGSASASEIIAGAIQDQDRGLVMGDTTFGKGAVQTLFELKDNTALKLTTAKYYIPSGRLIQKNRKAEESIRSEKDIADSLERKPNEKVYYTRKGRKVYGGGGIIPDILVSDPDFPLLIQNLLQKQYFFDFAVHYSSAHRDISEDFQANEEILKEFKDFIESKGFEYKSLPESELDKLKETISKEITERYSNRMKKILNELDYLIKEEKKADFERNKELLKSQIEEAILTKEFGSAARYKVWARYQKQIKKSIEILNDRNEYERLLSPD